MSSNLSKEESRFFEHGEVKLLATDRKKNTAMFKLCMPGCLFQAVTPSILGGGLVDNFRIRIPIAVWIPKLSDDRFNPDYMSQIDDISQNSNFAIQNSVNSVLKVFTQISYFMLNPIDLIPMLPLGVYVECEYRMNMDKKNQVLSGIELTPNAGTVELKNAMSEVFHCAANDLY